MSEFDAAAYLRSQAEGMRPMPTFSDLAKEEAEAKMCDPDYAIGYRAGCEDGCRDAGNHELSTSEVELDAPVGANDVVAHQLAAMRPRAVRSRRLTEKSCSNWRRIFWGGFKMQRRRFLCDHRRLDRHQKNCRYCGVRHLCDEYWGSRHASKDHASSDSRFSDAAVKIVRRHGRMSFDAVLDASPASVTGKQALLRVQDAVELQAG